MTEEFLINMLKNNKRLYIATPECNEILYLHQKGFKVMKNLEMFPDLKCLYFEGNGATSFQGLESNIKLKSLFF
jgi:hypothetical protein